ncbi:MAG: ThuA domain-containing protein [Planctomycetota bacterium]
MAATKHSLFVVLLVISYFLVQRETTAQEGGGSDEASKIVFLVGPCSHSGGSHEAAAGARLLKRCVDQAGSGKVQTEIFYTWPEDDSCLDSAATLVFTGDVFPGERFEQSERAMDKIGKLMEKGCGLVCFHYATGVQQRDVGEDGYHPLLDWMGGYHSAGCRHHKSRVGMYPAVEYIAADPNHPVCRGWKQFTLPEEPYWESYFGPSGAEGRVTAIARADLPPEAPTSQILIWAYERKDGGRAVGFTPPHFFVNWRNDDMRTAALNSIYWTAKLEIPERGVATQLPDLQEFQPGSVQPVKAPEWWKK